MPTPLHRLLGLPRGEIAPLLGLAGVHLLLGGAVAAGDAAVQTVFISRAGADRLPEVLLLRAVASPPLVLLYAWLARGRSPRAVMASLGLAGACAEAGAFLLAGLSTHGAMAAYVLHELGAGLLAVHWGVYLLAELTGERALRGTSLVYAAARGGGALAGLGLVPLVTVAGPAAGILLSAGLFGATGLLALARRSTAVPAPIAAQAEGTDEVARPTLAPERRAGLRLLFASPLLAAIAASTALLVLSRYALRYQEQALLERLPEPELARLLALYSVAGNLLALVFALVVAGRLLRRRGLAFSNGLYALALLGGQGALLLAPGVGAALTSRFVDGELKDALKTPVSSLFYEAFAPSARAAARALVLGVVSPVAQVVAAVGLAALVAGADAWAVGAAGLLVATLHLAANVAQNRRYEASIRRGSLPGRE